MAVYYSPSTRAFYHRDLHGDAIPADSVAVLARDHHALIAGQAQGSAIVPGADGTPMLESAPAPSTAKRRASAIARVKREAARRIEAVSPLWRQINDWREGGADAAARFAAIDAIRAASWVIEDQIAGAKSRAIDAVAIANHPAWPQIISPE